jgi:hypothetical protein
MAPVSAPPPAWCGDPSHLRGLSTLLMRAAGMSYPDIPVVARLSVGLAGLEIRVQQSVKQMFA